MTRSYKKNPYIGFADSEKQDKTTAHRRERHHVKRILHINPLTDLLPHRKDFGDGDRFSKDGKFYLPAFGWRGKYISK